MTIAVDKQSYQIVDQRCEQQRNADALLVGLKEEAMAAAAIEVRQNRYGVAKQFLGACSGYFQHLSLMGSKQKKLLDEQLSHGGSFRLNQDQQDSPSTVSMRLIRTLEGYGLTGETMNGARVTIIPAKDKGGKKQVQVNYNEGIGNQTQEDVKLTDEVAMSLVELAIVMRTCASESKVAEIHAALEGKTYRGRHNWDEYTFGPDVFSTMVLEGLAQFNNT